MIMSNLLSSVLDAGRCEFIFQHYTKEAQQRRVYLNEMTQLTIMVADKQFYETQYSNYHGAGLEECNKS